MLPAIVYDMIYGNELPYDNSDPILYKYNIEPSKILILRITFYSIVMGDVITINIGKLANQFSISKFLLFLCPICFIYV